MGWRNEQCRKVCRIIDNFLANRPTERDSLIVAVQKAFDALEQAKTNCSDIPNNSGTIYRQQAIDEITEYGFGNTIYMSVAELKRRIEQLPPAQPERKTGHWIPFDVPWYRCSECGAVRENNAFMEYYCPNCGADMRGEQE